MKKLRKTRQDPAIAQCDVHTASQGTVKDTSGLTKKRVFYFGTTTPFYIWRQAAGHVVIVTKGT